MSTKFSQFTTSATPALTEYAVGYATAVSGGERRWLWSDLQTTILGAPLTLPTYQSGNYLTLTTPNPTDATYDSNPIAAIYINGPASATTRNYISGIWVNTNGSAIDKGRGIGVVNTGASDSLYLQQDGPGSTGIASLLTTSATGSAYGGVFGTTLSVHTALTLRQETALVPTAQSATLLSVEANGSATEMVRLNSSVASQAGIVFRMLGASSNALSVLGTADAVMAQLSTSGALSVLSVTNQAASDLTISTSDTNKNIVLDPNGTGVMRLLGSDGANASPPTLGAKDFLRIDNAGNCNLAFIGSSSATGEFKWYFNGDTVQTGGITCSGSSRAIGFRIGNGATGPTLRASISSTGNLIVDSAVTETGLTGAGGLRLSSTTDGSSGAGSFVTAGGIYAAKAIYSGTSITAAGGLNASTISTLGGTDLGGAGALLIYGASKGIRFINGSTGSIIEGVDNTGTGSYQPLIVGGLTVSMSISGTNALSLTSTTLVTTTSLQTAAPTTGTAGAWKLGIRVAATVALDTTQYIQLDVGGTLYKLAVVT